MASDTHKTTPARLEVAVESASIRLEKDGYDPRTTPIVVDANAPGVAVEVELVPKRSPCRSPPIRRARP
ncbi:MAG: hypothetical protein U0610_08865 [bacterium]